MRGDFADVFKKLVETPSKIERISMKTFLLGRLQVLGLHKNVWLLVFVRFGMCSGAVLVPGFVAMLKGMGLTLFDVMLTQAFFAVFMALAQVPTGYAADRIGRRPSIMFGFSLLITACLLFMRVSGFWSAVLAEVVGGLAYAFIMGADGALLFDSLKAVNAKDKHKEALGLIEVVGFVVAALFALLGGWLSSIDLQLAIKVRLVGAVLGFLGALALSEVRFKESSSDLPSMNAVVLLHLRDNIAVRWIIGYGALILGVNQVAVWLYPPHFEGLGIGLVGIGVCFSCMNMVAAASSLSAGWLERQMSDKISLLAICLAVVGGFLGLSLTIGVWSVGLSFFHQWARGYGKIVLADYLHQQVESEVRATVSSLDGMMSQLAYGLLILPVAMVADSSRWGERYALALAGIGALTFGMLLLLRKPGLRAVKKVVG